MTVSEVGIIFLPAGGTDARQPLTGVNLPDANSDTDSVLGTEIAQPAITKSVVDEAVNPPPQAITAPTDEESALELEISILEHKSHASKLKADAERHEAAAKKRDAEAAELQSSIDELRLKRRSIMKRPDFNGCCRSGRGVWVIGVGPGQFGHTRNVAERPAEV
ncbi:hypothetical protein H2201_003952 [Coniosporium apollinis]|uniref:GDP/GTP exchange factor Sec2 N-terminal domain-containing protein n=1 Tax=Coniosporium apollinis TaxID=61459 RepID=A0ABQ9NUE9_9PEZI|nr:hypothetical protein H2201_003952 [Coniosporium apollinis]